MDAFFLSTLSNGGVEVEDYAPTETHRGWDEIRATVAGRMSMDSLREKFQPGKFANKGQGFVVMDVSPKAAPAGWSRATVSLQGLWRYKKWGEATAQPLRRDQADVSIKTAVSTWTVFPKASTVETVPGYRVTALDGTAPNLKAVGKKGTVPYPGLVFPSMTQSDNPWTFPSTGYDPTRNEPYGWVLWDIPAVEEIGLTRKLYRKELIWVFVWQWTP